MPFWLAYLVRVFAYGARTSGSSFFQLCCSNSERCHASLPSLLVCQYGSIRLQTRIPHAGPVRDDKNDKNDKNHHVVVVHWVRLLSVPVVDVTQA